MAVQAKVATVVKRGERGQLVLQAQLLLNAHLAEKDKLQVDGVFGPKTEAALKRFQKQAKLEVDGLLGPKTLAELTKRPLPEQAALKKFYGSLGSIGDFVNHLRELEMTSSGIHETVGKLKGFSKTRGGSRYYITTSQPRVVDFQHFFAAFIQAYDGRMAFGFARGPGNAMALGVALEISQCVRKALGSEIDSCFSPEDLGSNRLGAHFANYVRNEQDNRKYTSLAGALNAYLRKVAPEQNSAQQVANPVVLPGIPRQRQEALYAMSVFVIDIFRSRYSWY
ncbi:MAG: peptidoglycan-binding protein [Paracoccaceae bacterium]